MSQSRSPWYAVGLFAMSSARLNGGNDEIRMMNARLEAGMTKFE
jgi:hypothetical protein